MIAERQREALRTQKEWLEHLKTAHGCGCIVKKGEERQPDICWDCYDSD